METAGQIVKDALYELTLQGEEQTVPAVEVQTGIRYLNRMMQMLDINGVKLGYTVVSAPNDVLTTPQGVYEAMVIMLAVRLANQYDFPITPNLQQLKRESERTLYKAGVTLGKQNFPSSLPVGSGNDGGADTIYGDHFFDGCCEDQDECKDEN